LSEGGAARETTLAALQELVRAFAEARNWGRFHNPKNLAEAIVIEAAELLERFQWRPEEACRIESLTAEDLHALQSEIADVLIYSLNLANVVNIDAAAAIEKKLRENEVRFPIRDDDQGGPWKRRQ
jgi:NTP pyrophosphatase (non-canonical NTP hydrolase)